MDADEDFDINEEVELEDSDIELEDGSNEAKTASKPIKIKTDDDDDEIDNVSDDDDEIDNVSDDESEFNDGDSVVDENINNNIIPPEISTFELSDDSDSDDDDENYLQKFDESIQNRIIEDYHPELKSHNYEEIKNLSRVVRNDEGEIIDPLHKTLPFITKYEKARIIGERTKQINSGAEPLVDVEPSVIDGYLIALKEFEEKKTPFILKRPLPNGGCEYWRMSDLEILV
jgi:DNA-directed RNA polymerase I, II, and III subunit RPABC2|tara:strand:- start:4599 stop:5288 length:690 start_codon:yes stop_codon:yes gene_type:complete